jgi:hypothetical protein
MDEPDFALHIRQLMALAFIPPDDVIAAFEELVDSEFFQQNAQDLQELMNYFEDTWIGRPARRGGRSNPLFAIEIWNVHNSALQDLPKTNNSVEGWHRAFSQLLGASHPTIWRFIDSLKKEQSMNELKLEQFLSGQHPPRARKIYREVARRIKTIVEDYGNRTTLDFLRGIGHNINLNI